MHGIFMAGDGTVEENLQRAEEEHGQLPDATAALAAARQLVAAGGPYTIEAAEFLIERSAVRIKPTELRPGSPNGFEGAPRGTSDG